MPHCSAHGCNFQTKGKKESDISLHSFPKQNVKRKQWEQAVGRVSLPKDPRLCSQHFTPDCFDNSIALQRKLIGGSRWKRKLKEDALPTIFSHKPVKFPRRSSEKRAERQQREEVLQAALTFNVVPSPVVESPEELFSDTTPQLAQEEQHNECVNVEVTPEFVRTLCDVGTQTESVVQVPLCDATMQFPQDASEAVWLDHIYPSRAEEYMKPQDEQSDTTENDSDAGEAWEYDSQFELFSDHDSIHAETEATSVNIENMYLGHEAEVEVSQPSQPSTCISSQYEGNTTCSQDTCDSQGDVLEELNLNKQRVFLVYEEQLKELLRFCPKCGSLVIEEETNEVKNEGSQLSLELTCMNGCNYRWQSQPSLTGTKGAGNLLIAAAIFFSGIHFAKFEQFSANANLKTISEDTYTNLRKNYVFPVVKSTWEEEQDVIFEELKSRDAQIALAGDGRCDSPGHCAKYCTYTLLDVESQKVVDFKVISVSQVTSSNVMEIKGFRETLQNVEACGVEPSVISTDRHPQIRKEMRVNHPNKDHQFDPWHLAKSISKKLALAAKKKDCGDLANWIPSIVNHLWWSATTCEGNPEILKEKWTSTIHHVVNRHDWPGNRHYHQCPHGELDPRMVRKKKWLEPGSAPHKALVNVVKDKRLLKDLEHLVKCVHTTSLEIYHSMYLKYLPKLTHFSHEVMMHGTMLAALDHNKNANRQQVWQKELHVFFIQ